MFDRRYNYEEMQAAMQVQRVLKHFADNFGEGMSVEIEALELKRLGGSPPSFRANGLVSFTTLLPTRFEIEKLPVVDMRKDHKFIPHVIEMKNLVCSVANAIFYVPRVIVGVKQGPGREWEVKEFIPLDNGTLAAKKMRAAVA